MSIYGELWYNAYNFAANCQLNSKQFLLATFCTVAVEITFESPKRLQIVKLPAIARRKLPAYNLFITHVVLESVEASQFFLTEVTAKISSLEKYFKLVRNDGLYVDSI